MTTAQQLVHAYEAGPGLAPSAWADLTDPGARLAATLPVWPLAGGSVAAVQLAVNRFRATSGLPTRPVVLDSARVCAAFASERLFRHSGAAPSIFNPLSGFFRTADGWVRTHANYPHHRRRLAAALGLAADVDAEQVGARLAALSGAECEALALDAGAIAVRVRAEGEWSDSPMGRAAATGALVALDRRAADRPTAESIDQVTTRTTGRPPSPTGRAQPTPGRVPPRSGTPSRHAPTVDRPLRGIRVLDLTRVLAGPVATRTLALLGADVLRIDPPRLPEIDWQFRDTCQGKRSTLLDLRTNLTLFEQLLGEADVLVTGYRPGALATVGIRTRPGLIHASVSAWGVAGPWGDRRGFDSIVQAATGIALIEGSMDRPGALPAQALDHASGYLLAAGTIDALCAHADDGHGRDVRVSLARTASWLLAGDRTPDHPAAEPPDPAVAVTHGAVTTAAPAFAEYADYRWPAPEYGGHDPRW
ncbi:CoA transferase [Nocardia mangyaensis]|uniref:CoA transferase n=1 Tax=Nocardia mangyaensis TaxID=2213200 RepID=UPI002675B39A|nr:CoA transferase [Nocardia mangyaensis]MDO3646525.1 CoA transferase [Nocardia mangyaensis]